MLPMSSHILDRYRYQDGSSGPATRRATIYTSIQLDLVADRASAVPIARRRGDCVVREGALDQSEAALGAIGPDRRLWPHGSIGSCRRRAKTRKILNPALNHTRFEAIFLA